MTSSRLTPALLRLLESHLDSIEKMEILSLVMRTPAGVSPTIMSSTLLPGSEFERILAQLVTAGFVVEVDQTLQLGPRAKQPQFEELMTIYEEDRLVVFSALSAIAMQRIRSMTARSFADAFVVRHRKGEDDE